MGWIGEGMLVGGKLSMSQWSQAIVKKANVKNVLSETPEVIFPLCMVLVGT